MGVPLQWTLLDTGCWDVSHWAVLAPGPRAQQAPIKWLEWMIGVNFSHGRKCVSFLYAEPLSSLSLPYSQHFGELTGRNFMELWIGLPEGGTLPAMLPKVVHVCPGQCYHFALNELSWSHLLPHADNFTIHFQPWAHVVCGFNQNLQGLTTKNICEHASMNTKCSLSLRQIPLVGPTVPWKWYIPFVL